MPTDDLVSQTKSELRKEFRSRLRERSDLPMLGGQVVAHLLRLNEIRQATQLALFAATPWEVDLKPLWDRWPSKCAYPKCGPGRSMEFFIVCDWESLRPGHGGILEPSNVASALRFDDASVALVPGVGFDEFGGRLGTGKGFYDRYLVNFPGLKIGVGFECQVAVSRLAQQPTDVRMDGLCTERGYRMTRQ